MRYNIFQNGDRMESLDELSDDFVCYLFSSRPNPDACNLCSFLHIDTRRTDAFCVEFLHLNFLD